MTTVFEQIKSDSLQARKTAMKTKAMPEYALEHTKALITASILSTVIGKLDNASKTFGAQQLDDMNVLQFIKSYVKSLKDNEYRRDEENIELEILESYLPSLAPIEDVEKIIDEIIADADQVSMRLMGPIMKAVKDQFGPIGFDGEAVSTLVKKKLAK